MGNCLCMKETVDDTFNADQLHQVISDSYIHPTVNNNTSKETEIDVLPKQNNARTFKLHSISCDNKHIKSDKNGVYLNHFSPLPGSSSNSSKIKTAKSKSDFHIKLDQNGNGVALDHYSPLIYSSNTTDEKSKSLNLSSNNAALPQIACNPYHNEEKANLYSKQIDFASGAFAHVFICNVNDTKVAIKKIDVEKNEHHDAVYNEWSSKTLLKDAETELNLLQHLRGNINIIHLIDNFYETIYDDLYLYLVMDFIETSLEKEIMKYGNEGKNLPVSLIKIYSFQILQGLNYMKMKKVIHKDVKPENILIDPLTNVIKICDFGCSQLIENQTDAHDMDNYVCSRYYRAPELILECGDYSYCIDMWSFGCIISEMYLGQIMFDGDTTRNQLNEIIKILGVPNRSDLREMNDKYEYDKLLNTFECTCYKPRDWKFVFIAIGDMSQCVVDLIDKILIYAPNDRLVPNAAMKHEYFNGLSDDEGMLQKYNVPRHVLRL